MTVDERKQTIEFALKVSNKIYHISAMWYYLVVKKSPGTYNPCYL